ncbi:cation transporter [Streptomyces sp. NPDC091682]|uniref:cation transporter n=1 Tax=unclassified Streptomyces TaxID=2593676 RepID=UPI0037F900EC
MATTTPSEADHSIELAITGMTCASCVARVERKLAKLPGVSATVNLATATAHITRDNPEISPEQLIADARPSATAPPRSAASSRTARRRRRGRTRPRDPTLPVCAGV